ncbi:MAG: peptidase S41, partial [Chitinophagaceae bacterium]|nr:peptidase S41 [Chitinophagaceae bacterium]
HTINNRNIGDNYYVTSAKRVGNTLYANEKAYKDSIFPSPQLRLLCLSRYWNIINYFYPYKYVIGENWDDVLEEMIPKFKYAKDTVTYNLTMLELIVKINDSHAGLVTSYTNQYWGLKYPPFYFKIIDNKAIVTGFYNDTLCKANDIRKGDVFLSAGGESIKDILNKKLKYTVGSNEAVKLRNSGWSIFNGSTDSVNVQFEREGVVSAKNIRRYLFAELNYKWEPAVDTVKILEGNIGYINMGLLVKTQVEGAMKKLSNTRAIIFDVRNYPNNTLLYVSTFLNSDRKPFAKFTIPDLTYPGVFNYTRPAECGIKENKNYYKGKVILLFNELTQSHAEFTLMALQTAPEVIGIGSQTAGADGDVSLITLPGDYKTYITGIGVYYPDGRETQRIGIIPDIQIKPTIEGIRAGRDEVLEKAIEILK